MFNKKLKREIAELETKLALINVQNTFMEAQNRKSKQEIEKLVSINSDLIGKNMLLRKIANKFAPKMSNCVNYCL